MFGVNKVHYGQCGSGEFPPQRLTPRICASSAECPLINPWTYTQTYTSIVVQGGTEGGGGGVATPPLGYGKYFSLRRGYT